jgi:glucose-1-phosphate thymidylyltransferase
MTRYVERKGIILAGGAGSRLFPITNGVSKQLLPVFDKPMVYYPISLLLSIGVTEIAIITKPTDTEQFKKLLGDGSQWGCCLNYLKQNSPDGIAQAYLIAKEFLNNSPSALVLGDNLFYGRNLNKKIVNVSENLNKNTIFAYYVSEPSRYGVIEFDEKSQPNNIIEKPSNPKSNYAVTGLYLLGNDASSIASTLNPSARGELEITDLLNIYLAKNELNVEILDEGTEWLDTGTYSSLLEASNFVRTIQERKGRLIGSPDCVAHEMGLVGQKSLSNRLRQLPDCDYKKLALRNLS